MPEPDVPPEVWDKVAAELARQKSEGQDRRERRGLWIVALASLVLALVAAGLGVIVVTNPETVGLVSEDQLNEQVEDVRRAATTANRDVAASEDVLLLQRVAAQACAVDQSLEFTFVQEGRREGIDGPYSDACDELWRVTGDPREP